MGKEGKYFALYTVVTGCKVVCSGGLSQPHSRGEEAKAEGSAEQRNRPVLELGAVPRTSAPFPQVGSQPVQLLESLSLCPVAGPLPQHPPCSRWVWGGPSTPPGTAPQLAPHGWLYWPGPSRPRRSICSIWMGMFSSSGSLSFFISLFSPSPSPQLF